jgi:hypothetical protein
MRNLFRTGAMTLAAALISSTAFAATPALSNAEPFQLAQLERGDRGGRGGGEARTSGGQRGGGGEARGGGGQRGGGEIRSGGGQRGGGEMRSGREMSGGGETRQRMERAPRSQVQQFDRQRRDVRPPQRTERRDVRPGQRFDRRDSRQTYQRFQRHRPEYRGRYPFRYLGGPRIIVRGYGPGWCQGLHTGYHWAPRIGWHYGTHRGLYRCY